MFDSANQDPSQVPSCAELTALIERLAELDGSGASEAEHIDRVAVLERVKGAAAAAQARVTARLVADRSRTEAARGVPAARRCKGLAAEIGLARREPGTGGSAPRPRAQARA